MDYYWVFAGAVLSWAAMVVTRHVWIDDMDMHVGTLRALIADPSSPSDPVVGGQVATPYFTPYMVFLAAVARATGADAQSLLEGMALINVALLLWAVRRFCRHVSERPWVAVLAGVFALLLWGPQWMSWSGFIRLGSLSFGLPYPSLFATALMLLVWDVFLRYRRKKKPRQLAVLAVLGAIVVLVHPFTAANTALGLITLLLARPGAWRLGDLGRLAVTATAAALFVMAWPYFEATSLLPAAAEFSEIHRRLATDMAGKYGLALIGVPALLLRFRARLGRELLVLFLIGVASLWAGLAVGWYGSARVIPVAVLALHISLAAYIAERREWPVGLLAPVAAMACAITFATDMRGVARHWMEKPPAAVHAIWRQLPAQQGYRQLLWPLHPGDVVIAPHGLLGWGVAWGVRTVAPPWPYPFLADEAARRKAVRLFYDRDTTAAERMQIVTRYRVRCHVSFRGGLLATSPLPGFRVVANGPGRAVLLCRRLDQRSSLSDR